MEFLAFLVAKLWPKYRKLIREILANSLRSSWNFGFFWPSKSESEQRVWCVNIETGSTRTQTIPDASEKDVMSRNQTHVLKKHTGCMLCAYSLSQEKILQKVQKTETYCKPKVY